LQTKRHYQMSEIICKIVKKLNKYPKVVYQVTENSIHLNPTNENGFSIVYKENDDNTFTVSYDKWHDNFTNQDNAISYFILGLTNKCRLKVTQRKLIVYKWTVELYQDGKWLKDKSICKINLKFWILPKVKYLQNNVIICKFGYHNK